MILFYPNQASVATGVLKMQVKQMDVTDDKMNKVHSHTAQVRKNIENNLVTER